MYHGPDGDAAGADQPAEPRLVVGAHGEVVVDDGELPVEEEVGVARIGLEVGEQPVEQLHQPEAEALERQVPLPVPVRVRHDRDDPLASHPDRMPQRAGSKRRRRRLLVTTKRLEAAIAAPASIGLSSPAAASGTAATL